MWYFPSCKVVHHVRTEFGQSVRSADRSELVRTGTGCLLDNQSPKPFFSLVQDVRPKVKLAWRNLQSPVGVFPLVLIDGPYFSARKAYETGLRRGKFKSDVRSWSTDIATEFPRRLRCRGSPRETRVSVSLRPPSRPS